MEEDVQVVTNENSENLCVSISNTIIGVLRKKIFISLKVIYDFDKNINIGMLNFIYNDPTLRIKSDTDLNYSDLDYVIKHMEKIFFKEKDIPKFPPPEIIIKSGNVKIFFKYQKEWSFGIVIDNYGINNLVFSEIKELLSFLKSGYEKIINLQQFTI